MQEATVWHSDTCSVLEEQKMRASMCSVVDAQPFVTFEVSSMRHQPEPNQEVRYPVVEALVFVTSYQVKAADLCESLAQ